MQRQNLGTPFLERIMRKGKKQNALLNTPQSGGVNLPSPTGLGSGQKPPPRKSPAAVAGGPPSATPAAPAQTATPAPAGQRAPMTPEQEPMPLLDDEFPIDTVAGADGEPAVVPAVTLTDRFYRTYGRMPNEVDLYILSFRKQFEKNRGRPPSKGDIVASVGRTTLTSEVAPI